MAVDGETASGPAHTPGTNTPGASTPADVELPSPRVRETTTEADYSYDTKPGMLCHHTMRCYGYAFVCFVYDPGINGPFFFFI